MPVDRPIFSRLTIARSVTQSLLKALFAKSAVILTAPALAQGAYPDRPVKVIVALPAGGSVDIIARTLGQKLNVSLGQAFVVDNRAGGSGQIGMPVVSKAPADGYTLAVSPASFLTTNKSVFKTLPYDPEADFSPVSRLVNQHMVLVVSNKQKYPTVAAFLAAAKAAPGSITYASSAGTAGAKIDCQGMSNAIYLIAKYPEF